MAGRGVDGELCRLEAAAEQARQSGLRINAGHGLTLGNLPQVLERVPHLEELNIGHSLIAHALVVGLDASVRDFLQVMRNYPPTAPSP